MSPRVLIVDDQDQIRDLLRIELTRNGFEVEDTGKPLEALERLKERAYDVVVTDIKMPKMDGLTLLRRIKAIRPLCEVVVITAFASVETAREALKAGAVDYLTKPFSIRGDVLPLIQSVTQQPKDAEADASNRRWGTTRSVQADALDSIVGCGAAMQPLLHKLRKVAPSDAPVLLRGPSGSGKELMASALHSLSRRCEGPMIRVNCAAIPETLLEATLFGYRKGAFTGANSDREGLFQAADGGTLFLDEIGELPPSFQPKLLRVLQEGEFNRVGDAGSVIKVDVRTIAATNRNLEEAMREGSFREDLFYRLNVVPLEVPALADRRDDLPALIDHFVARYSAEEELRFTSSAYDLLVEYPWPGNVRELANTIQHAILLHDGNEMDVGDLTTAVQDHLRLQGSPVRVEGSGDAGAADEALERVEIRCIERALAKTSGNRTHAARMLGLTRRALGYRIQKYGLDNSSRNLSEGVPIGA